MNQTILDIIIRGKDELSGVVKSASGSVSGFSNAITTMAAASTIALVGAGVAAIKSAADYQTLVERIVTTGGEQQKFIGAVEQGLLNISSATGVSASQIAQAYYYASSAGYTYANGGLKVVAAATQAAAMEGGDAIQVTDALTSVMRDYHEPASAAADVTSMLVTAVSRGKTTFPLLTNSLHSVLAIAAAAHIPLSDILGDISAITVHGVSADQTTQDLAHGIQKLQQPTTTMTSELSQLGINSADLNGMLGTKGLSGTLEYIANAILTTSKNGKVLISAFNNNKLQAQDAIVAYNAMPASLQSVANAYLSGSTSVAAYHLQLQEMGGPQANLVKQFVAMADKAHGYTQLLKSGKNVMQDYDQVLQAATGDSTTYTDALMLTGENYKYVNDAVKAVGKSTADAHGNVQGWGDYQKTFNAQLHEATTSLQNIVTAIGLGLLPSVTAVAKSIASFLLPIAEWASKNKELATGLFEGTLAASALILVIGKGITAFKKIKAITQDVGTVISKGWDFSKNVAGFVKTGASAVSNAAISTAAWIKSAALTSAAWIKSAAQTTAAWIASTAKQAALWVANVASSVAGAAVTAAAWVGSALAASAAWVVANAVMLAGIGLVVLIVVGAVYEIITHWKQISAFFAALWKDITTGLNNFINGAIRFFTNLPGMILGALGNVGSLLYNVGQNMMNGLIGGISSFAGKVGDSIKNVASSTVNSFKNLLGIHSPSTVFAGIGQNIGEGLVQGIQNSSRNVSGAVNKLVAVPSTTASQLAATAQTSSSGTSAYGTQSGININLGPGGITVNIGLYAGTQTEKQQVAVELWQALMQVARTYNKAGNVPDFGIRTA